MIRPKQLARIGAFYLHEAVLDVLYDHHQHDKHGLGPAEIGRRAGIYREPGVVHMNDAIVTGCLNELHDQRRVERKPQEGGVGGWRLSEEEYGRRSDDSQS